jgi:Domain of unknown function (DUF1874)
MKEVILVILTSTFSPSMISAEHRHEACILLETVDLEMAQTCAETAKSAVAHPATAKLMSEVLGFEVPFERVALALEPGDSVLVFQLDQALFRRLNEGETLDLDQLRDAMAQGALSWMLVSISTKATVAERSDKAWD